MTNIMENWRNGSDNSIYQKIPGTILASLEFIYVTKQFQENPDKKNNTSNIFKELDGVGSRNTLTNWAENSPLFNTFSDGNSRRIELTKEGERAFHIVRDLFENDFYEKAMKETLDFRDLALRWPTEEELSDRLGHEIDQKLRSKLIDEIEWKEPSNQKIEAEREELERMIKRIAVDELDWSNNPYVKSSGHPGENYKIAKYKKDNEKVLKDLKVREEMKTGNDWSIINSNTSELIEIPHEIQRILDLDRECIVVNSEGDASSSRTVIEP